MTPTGHPIRESLYDQPARCCVVDRLDVAILAELFRDPRAAHADVAPKVGLSPNAVALRLRRLEEAGVLQGVAASPAPALLGLTEGFLVFSHVDDLDEREADILASLPDVPGVRFVDVTLDRSVQVTLLFRDEADWERIERAAVLLVGKPPAMALKGAPAPRAALAAPDWKIVRALLPDGRLSLKDVTARSGLSFKTAKRRLGQLLRTGHLRMEPVLSPSEARGLVLCSLSLVLREGHRAEEALRLLPGHSIAQSREGSPIVQVHLARDTLREVQADARALKASPAVERVLLAIGTRRRADAWLDDAVAAEIAALARPAVPIAPVPAPRAK